MVDRLPAIVCPALVLQGADDEHGTAAQVEAVARGVSGPVETWIVPAPSSGALPLMQMYNSACDTGSA